MSDGVIVAPEPSALTFSIQDVVSWEHDAAAHDVTFEAARTKRVADPAAVKDLTVVCQERMREILVNSLLNNVFVSVNL